MKKNRPMSVIKFPRTPGVTPDSDHWAELAQELDLPGNPRSWGIEAAYVPSALEHSLWLTRALEDSGCSPAMAASVTMWVARRADGDDPVIAGGSRTNYRKALAALPAAPWAPTPNDQVGRRRSIRAHRTAASIERGEAMVSLRGVTAGLGWTAALMAAGVPPWLAILATPIRTDPPESAAA